MYDARTLKPQIFVDDHTCECPVLGCTTRVQRQRKTFKRDDRFLCAAHGIYVSPSTYDHLHYEDNLLSSRDEDRQLLRGLLSQKRETERLGRERSEDALTFNVIRSLEKSGALDHVLFAGTGDPVSDAVPSYWCLNSSTGLPDARLAAARDAFREVKDRGSEPDLLIDSADTLFLVEAKLGAANSTTPAHARSLKSYEAAQDGWYSRVFSSPIGTVALDEKLYQLMRLWLLGTWMADRAGKRFVLLSLCANATDRDIEARFKKHIVVTEAHRFVRFTWEEIRELCRTASFAAASDDLIKYLDYKTLGYTANGALRMAFRGQSIA